MDVLARIAALLRELVVPHLHPHIDGLDGNIRLVLRGAGPVYMNDDALGVSVDVRRVGYCFYDRGFANALFR